MREIIIGLDIGTTSSKAVVFDPSGSELASAERVYRLSAPQPGWAEQDPQEIWQATVQAIRAVLHSAATAAPVVTSSDTPTLLHPIALAVASQSGSLVPARADGTPVYPCITWMDSRSDVLVKEWLGRGTGALIRNISGWNVHAGLPLATVAWLRENNPAIFASTQRWLCINDWVVQRLSGQFVTNPSNAGVTQLLDVRTQSWRQELCDLCGTRPDQWSTVQASGQPIGRITRQASAETGLPEDTLIVNGGHDQSCTSLALRVMEPGQVLLACGTSWVVSDVVAQPDVQQVAAELDINHHALNGRWTISQSLGGLGASFEWLVNQCWAGAATREERFSLCASELQDTRPGCDGLLFLAIAGGHAAPAGAQCGGFVNVQLSHTRAQMARAVMEGAAYELRLALQQIQHAGTAIAGLWMFGGATRSAIWPGIVADATRLPLQVTHSAHLPAVGAAILAAWGAGVFPTIQETTRHFAQPVRNVQPVPDRCEAYERAFNDYGRALNKIAC